jgi:hypothetical protein
MQIIDDLEVNRRGPYGGGIGHVSFTGVCGRGKEQGSAKVELPVLLPARRKPLHTPCSLLLGGVLYDSAVLPCSRSAQRLQQGHCPAAFSGMQSSTFIAQLSAVDLQVTYPNSVY